MKIALVVFSLEMGGAERVMSLMANHWAARGHDVTIVTLRSSSRDFYPLLGKVGRVRLNADRASRNPLQAVLLNIHRILRLRAAFKALEPDAIIAFTTRVNVLTLLATRGLGVPVVVSERMDLRRAPVTRFWKRLMKIMYRRADAVVMQCQEALDIARIQLGTSRLTVIPNPVPSCEDNAEPATLVETWPPGSVVIAVGRFVAEKGFDILIEAFAALAGRHPEWRLMLLGDGPEESALRELARQYGIAQRVWMPGRVRNVGAWLRRADMFVLSSRFEGFPNALLEAMACGLPTVSFACPTGPRDIIRHGIDGLLVPPKDVSALTAALSELMSDAAARKQLGERAREVVGCFSVEYVMGLWDRLLESAAPGRADRP